MLQNQLKEQVEEQSNVLFKAIEDVVGLSPDIQSKLLSTIFAIIILLILRNLILKVIFHFNDNVRTNYNIRNIAGNIFFLIAAIVITRIWFQGFDSILTYFGLLSAGVAIALKDPIVNLAGYFFILFRRPFEVGDRIEIGDHTGDVIDLRIFQFSLNEIGNWVNADQSTGRIIHVPNSCVFTQTQANYSKGFSYIWNEIPILLTFESDWEKAKILLEYITNQYSKDITGPAQQAVKKAAQKYMILYTKLTPKVYTSVRDSGVELTLRYLTLPRKRRNSEEVLWEQILREFAKHDDIDYAYPSIRYYNNKSEGKPGKKPPPAE